MLEVFGFIVLLFLIAMVDFVKARKMFLNFMAAPSLCVIVTSCAQGLGALQEVFGSDAMSATGSNPEKNARVAVAT